MEKINIAAKFDLFAEHWRPRVIAAVNSQEIKVVKVKGQFPWHHHDNEDEFFLVWRGRFRVEFRDQIVALGPCEYIVVPKGIEHRTGADEEAEVICFEPEGFKYRQRFRRYLYGSARCHDLTDRIRHAGYRNSS